MSKQAKQIQSFLSLASQARGGRLPSAEIQGITDWYQEVLDSIHCVNLVIDGDADIAWDVENNVPIFALTDKGFDKADPVLREKVINKNVIN